MFSEISKKLYQRIWHTYTKFQKNIQWLRQVLAEKVNRKKNDSMTNRETGKDKTVKNGVRVWLKKFTSE